MDNDINMWLYDISTAIANINSFLPEKRIFEDFRKDLKTRQAIERNIEIIGEAMNRILKARPDILITNARKIVDTRNRFIHGYESISEDVIWRIVINDLPHLKSEVEKLLAEE